MPVSGKGARRDSRPSLRHTEQAYILWIKQFIYFHGKRHPFELGDSEVTAFLTYPAQQRNVAPATQNQPLNAFIQ
ncbi:MAG: phage integrase N-terminal SAM-like domain-containing protein [Gammaproteobacteria bacterium]